jgi:nicotinamide mononucleotide transporter
MHDLFNFLFTQYKDYTFAQIVLESIGVITGIISVWYSKNNNILLYPAAVISSLIYIWLLYDWQLYGDLIINIYYFYMGVYGWILWGKRYGNDNEILKITKNSQKDYLFL